MNLMVKLPKWGAQRVCISVMGSRQGLSNGFTGIQLDEKRVMRVSALAGTNTDNEKDSIGSAHAEASSGMSV
jgi:hypothetical protein